MRNLTVLGLAGMLLMLAGCATTGNREPQIQRISPEELERIMPKPVPNLTLEEIVQLSQQKVPPEQIIEKIKATNSAYDLTPTQVVNLSKQGVSGQVLDYIQAARQQAIRDGFAEEINKREKQKQLEQQRLRQEYLWRSQPYYDPFWGPGFSYWGPSFYYGPGYRYRRW